MRYPCVVAEWACNTPVRVQLTGEINEDGEEVATILYDGRCNYTERARIVTDEHGRKVLLQAQAYFRGDIAPALPDITGEVIVEGGPTRRIYKSARPRNPDNTVNYTLLELM